jgi:hypothetical protein
MEPIFNYLKDPGWWFSTVLVAIIASVIAGFLKDRISTFLSHFSQKLRDRSTKRKIEQEELINILVSNNTYLVLAFLRVIFSVIMFIGTMTMFLLMPIYAEIKPSSLNSEISSAIKFFFSISVFPLLGGLSMGFGFRATSGLNIVAKAIKRYRIENKLPKLQ